MESDIYKKKELDKLTSNLTELLELILAELQQEIPEKSLHLLLSKLICTGQFNGRVLNYGNQNAI